MKVSSVQFKTAGATLHLVAHYARRRGLRPLVAKLVRPVAGRAERWYVTSGDLTGWQGAASRDAAITVRLACADDVPALARLGRQRADTLRAWMRPGWFVFVALSADEVIGYRALAPKPHPCEPHRQRRVDAG